MSDGSSEAASDVPIRDAAAIVLYRHENGQPELLLGRRSTTEVFLPDVFVFPGGRVDADDNLESDFGLSGVDQDAVGPSRSDIAPSAFPRQAIALAAVRELFEECGMIIGRRSANGGNASVAFPSCWAPFCATGFRPDLSSLRYFARALTPPARPRRYDTRFFLAPASAISLSTGDTDGELREIDWFSEPRFDELQVPAITRLIGKEAFKLMAQSAQLQVPYSVPFFVFDGSKFTRL